MIFTVRKDDDEFIGIGVANDDAHKKPGLYICNKLCATRVATFTDENLAHAFAEQFVAFMELAGLEIEKDT